MANKSAKSKASTFTKISFVELITDWLAHLSGETNSYVFLPMGKILICCRQDNLFNSSEQQDEINQEFDLLLTDRIGTATDKNEKAALELIRAEVTEAFSH
jgi:hypothetical protein